MSRRYTNALLTVIVLLLTIGVMRTRGAEFASSAFAQPSGGSAGAKPVHDHGMQLGNFSVSLAVKDIAASKAFYENLGFTVFMGKEAQKWLIMKNEDVVIGLFQGMWEKNMLTFNPGWDNNAQKLASYTDIRELQRQLKSKGVKFTLEADEKSTGPASFIVTDPDGNPILFDQHI